MPIVLTRLTAWVAASILGWVSAAEPTTPRDAVDAVALEGNAAIACEQIRDALAGDVRIWRLVRLGMDADAVAITAAPLVEQGYRASGFADATVTRRGSTLIVQEGAFRTWSDLVISAPSPAEQSLAAALLEEPTIPGSRLPIPADRLEPDLDRVKPLWCRGQPADFDPGFVHTVMEQIGRGWTSSGHPTPSVAVSVERDGEHAARCVVRIGTASPPVIAALRIDGAKANTTASILAWFDHQAGLRAGSPADLPLLNAACSRLAETGRFLGATVQVGADGVVTITVREHPLLPTLTATLTPWQQRWLDLGRQMQALFQTGPGILLRVHASHLHLDGSLRMSQRHGASLRLDADASGSRCLELLQFHDRFALLRSGGPPLSMHLTDRGFFGSMGLSPADDADHTVTFSFQMGFSQGQSGCMTWSCAPAALLATAGKPWAADPRQPGLWQSASGPDKDASSIAWDAQDRWLYWEFAIDGGYLRLAPAETPPPTTGGQDIPGLALWQETLRQLAVWLATRGLPAYDDTLAGIAAGCCVPAAAIWPPDPPDDQRRLVFSIPSAPAETPPPQTAMIAGWFVSAANALGSRIGPHAWPARLCLCAGACLDGDMTGFAALLQGLRPPERMGPLGRLAEAWLLQQIQSPLAADTARLGLQACTAAQAWDDICACVGSGDLLPRWMLAIEREEDAVRLAPPALRGTLVADLRALRLAPAGERQAFLAAAFVRWWDAELGTATRTQLERIAHPGPASPSAPPPGPGTDIVP